MTETSTTLRGEKMSRALEQDVCDAAARILRCPPDQITLHRIAGGNSLTTIHAVRRPGDDDPDAGVIVRVPPLARRSSTAHDVIREFKTLAAVAPFDVPAPLPIAVHWLPTVQTTALLEQFKTGIVLGFADPQFIAQLSPSSREELPYQAISGMAALHRIALAQTGLGSQAKAEGYFHRQIRRWTRQILHCPEPEIAPYKDRVEHISDTLLSADTGPAQTGIVHGDIDFHNLLFDGIAPPGQATTLSAILDWEMSTVGDVRADLGWLLSRLDDALPFSPLTPVASVLRQLGLSARQVTEMYQDAGGRPLTVSPSPFIGLARLKQTAIWIGHLNAVRAGVRTDERFEHFADYADELLPAWLSYEHLMA